MKIEAANPYWVAFALADRVGFVVDDLAGSDWAEDAWLLFAVGAGSFPVRRPNVGAFTLRSMERHEEVPCGVLVSWKPR